MFNEFIINKNILISNVKQAKKICSNCKICAMVKANAYGVGAKTVVKILNDYVDYFGVACFFEAKEIKNLTNKKILIVGPLEKRKLDCNFSYTCNSVEDLKFVASQNNAIPVHLKINTGMNRYGIKTIKELKHCLNIIKDNNMNLEGVFTHFSTSDEFVDVQFKKFKKFINVVKSFKFNPIFHCDNSETSFKFNHKMDMVRLGHCLYIGDQKKFNQVVKIVSQVRQINRIKKGEFVGYNKRFVAEKNMLVATVPFGYADGFSVNNIGFFLNIKNVECKILNVCMDCFMLDVTNLNLKIGDKIEILNEKNNLKFYAKNSKIIDYEIMCRFSFSRTKKILK